MAVRPQHTTDGGVMERRLRPIYDWLDNGNNKKALQETEKVLKKTPSLQAARALKALSLLRLGKTVEAHAVLDALVDEKPSDDTTLQAMTISYRECQQLHKVCALYEAAVKVEPGSEELHSHLFMSYVRIGDYMAQQRAAMALYKFAPKNPYYFWAVMSIVLQAKSTEDKTKKGILLSLAQRMVDNFITEDKIEAEQEARIYIMILELQEKWEDILKFMEGPLYIKLVSGSMPQASIPYLKHLGQWRKLNFLCKDLLLDNQDRWDYYLAYLDSVFELMKLPKDGTNGENNVDDTAEKCHEFICQLVESVSSGKTLRGPYLARLELWKRLSKVGDASALLGCPVALCVQYLRVFAHKPCAIPDIKTYIEMIPQKEREEKCREFLTCLGFDENSEPKTLDDVQRHVSCLGAWRLCAGAGARAGAAREAARLRGLYARALGAGLAEGTVTEFGPADGYAVLAAHHYFYAAVLQQSSAPVVEALCLLELVLHKSPANFHVKLLLVSLYHLLGNALAADTVYQRLEVKHVQLVSLGWLHGARLAAACAPARALQLLADARAFHTHHAKDSVEHLTYAYKYGTFEKLVELVAWRARLERCAGGAAGARERALLALLAGPAAPLHAPPPLPAALTDNRDLTAIISWEPPQYNDPDLQARTMDQETAYLRLKDGLVSAVALCIELADGRTVAEKREHYTELVLCIGALGDALDKCREKYSERERICISAPFPSRIIAFVNSPVPYRDLYTCTLRLVGELAMNESADTHELCARVGRLVERSQAIVKQSLDERLRSDDVLWAMREGLEDISNYLEYIGVVTFILGVCNELVAPTSTRKSKKKAAHKSPDEVRTVELLNELNMTVQRCISYLETVFEQLPTFSTKSTLEEELSKLNIQDSYQCPVELKLEKCYSDMSYDIRNVLIKKLKYLRGLVQ